MSQRGLIFDGPGQLRIDELEERALGAGEVRIKTDSVGICGSDVHGFTGANQRRVPGMVMGHEAAGIVVDVGSEVTAVTAGSRVVVNPAVTCGRCEFCLSGQDHRCPHRQLYGCVAELPGAFAQSLVVYARNAVAFAESAPLEWGALVEPFAVGDHGAGLLSGGADHGILVIGAGPIGLGAALGARRRGLGEVVVSEPNAHRREVAQALGFATFDPSDSRNLDAVDAAIDCVAGAATLQSALSVTRPGGEIVVVGLGATELPFSIERLVVGERVMRGSFNYSRDEFARVAQWVATCELDLGPVIEARVGLEGLIRAFEGYAKGTNEAVKTLYQPAAGLKG